MGCGQSSLKGDDVPDLNSQPVERPIKKVQTNFSDVNYDQDSQQRRMTEYAPNETPRQHPPVQEQDGEDANGDPDPTAGSSRPLGSGAFGGGGSGVDDGLAAGLPGRDASHPHQTSGLSDMSGRNEKRTSHGPGHDPAEENALKPYQTFDGTDWDNDNFQNQIPNPNQDHGDQNHRDQTSNPSGYDPTSRQAKRDFAEENDPATAHPGHDHSHGGDNGIGEGAAAQDRQQQKGSWLGQKYAHYQASKAGPGVNDEDLKRYTGKDRAEFGEWAETQPGVGARQPANDAGYAGGGGGFVS